MEVRVDLPPGSLIDPLGFCKAIARAIHPAGEHGLEGIECFDGKIVTHHLPVAQPVSDGVGSSLVGAKDMLIAGDGRVSDRLFDDDGATEGKVQPPLAKPVNREVSELSLPYKLTDDDRRALEEVLPQLPRLRYPMSEDEAAAVMKAYFALNDRPAWEPVLVTSETIERRKAKQDTVMHQHLQLLRDEVARGRLAAVDNNHVQVSALSIGCYLPREQAIAYLERSGIEYRDEKKDGDRRDVELPQIEAHPERSSGVVKPKLSPKQRVELVAEHARLEKEGANDPSEQVAKMFGITDRWVRKLVEKAKAEAEAKAKPTIANLLSATRRK